MGTKFRVIWILAFVFVLISAHAQDATMNVNDFYRELVPMTVPMQKKDRNGEICALLKVRLPIAGVKFEGNVIDYRFDVGEYLVYMSSGSRYLEIKCPNIKPLRVDFTDYTGIGRVASKTVYALNIDIIKGSGTEDPKGTLISEYQNLISQAHHYFENKKFSEARSLYEEAIEPQYLQYYNIDDFRWITICDSIITAQSNYRAITPRLADAFKGHSILAEPTGFSDGMMVIDNGYGHVSLVSVEGNRYELNDAFVDSPKLFGEGKLSVNLNDSHCYLGKNGAFVLGFRNSDYNKLFKDTDLEFGQFSNGYAVVFNRKNGNKGLINKYGKTVLPVTGKYKGIKVLDWKIILYDSKHIYQWDIPNRNSPMLDKRNIYKILDYDGFVGDVTEDYIIANDYDRKKIKIYPFNDSYIYSVNAERASAIDSCNILCYTGKEYIIYNFKFDRHIDIPSKRNVRVVAKGIMFDGQDCYSTNGNKLFSLHDPVEFSSVGYSDGYMLVKCQDKYRYIDIMGNTLSNSEFELSKDSNHLMLYYRKPFGDGFGLIMRNGEWGLIDIFGTTTFDYVN